MNYKAVLHGSFGKHFDEIRDAAKLFKSAGITLLAPDSLEITAIRQNFLLLEHEEKLDPRFVELRYLHNLHKLGPNGFSYFVNPEGYIGRSAALELGIALALGVQCFFSHKPKDLPIYIPRSNILSPSILVEKLESDKELPRLSKQIRRTQLYNMMQQLISPGSIVAAGGIIEHQSSPQSLPEVLLVKTHK